MSTRNARQNAFSADTSFILERRERMPKTELFIARHNECNGIMEPVKEDEYLLCLSCGERVPFIQAKEKCTSQTIPLFPLPG